MDGTYLAVFSTIAAILAVCVTLIAVFGGNRVHELREAHLRLRDDLAEKSTPKQLEKAIVVAEGSRDRVDNALLEMGKFRDGVHAEIQRFYQIMRRNENAVAKLNLTTSDNAPDSPSTPDEMPATAIQAPEEDGEAPISKAQLRKQARAAGL